MGTRLENWLARSIPKPCGEGLCPSAQHAWSFEASFRFPKTGWRVQPQDHRDVPGTGVQDIMWRSGGNWACSAWRRQGGGGICLQSAIAQLSNTKDRQTLRCTRKWWETSGMGCNRGNSGWIQRKKILPMSGAHKDQRRGGGTSVLGDIPNLTGQDPPQPGLALVSPASSRGLDQGSPCVPLLIYVFPWSLWTPGVDFTVWFGDVGRLSAILSFIAFGVIETGLVLHMSVHSAGVWAPLVSHLSLSHHHGLPWGFQSQNLKSNSGHEIQV